MTHFCLDIKFSVIFFKNESKRINRWLRWFMQSKRQEKQSYSVWQPFQTGFVFIIHVNIYVSASNEVNHSHKKFGKLLWCYFWRNKYIQKVISLNRLFILTNIRVSGSVWENKMMTHVLTQTSILKGLENTNPWKGDRNIVSGNTRFSPPEGAAEHSA